MKNLSVCFGPEPIVASGSTRTAQLLRMINREFGGKFLVSQCMFTLKGRNGRGTSQRLEWVRGSADVLIIAPESTFPVDVEFNLERTQSTFPIPVLVMQSRSKKEFLVDLGNMTIGNDHLSPELYSWLIGANREAHKKVRSFLHGKHVMPLAISSIKAPG